MQLANRKRDIRTDWGTRDEYQDNEYRRLGEIREGSSGSEGPEAVPPGERRDQLDRRARTSPGRRQQEDEEAFRPVATEMPMGVGGVRTENLERAIQMETSIVRSVKIFGALLQKAGPYLLLEILLPGGTLFALLLFLYKRRQQDGTPMPRAIFIVARVIDKVRAEIVYIARLHDIASLWRGRARERDGLEALGLAPGF
jgi:hypothetical protein